jgi:glycosyltransferase involved in cell wall biosynthesis
MGMFKLIIINHASLRVSGGTEIFILDIVKYLKDMGFRITVLAPNSTLGEPERTPLEVVRRKLGEVDYREFASFELPLFKKPALPKNVSEILKIVKEADLVYFSNYYLQGLLTAKIRWSLRNKLSIIAGIHSPLLHNYIISVRDILHNFYIKKINLMELKLVDAIHTINPCDNQYLISKGFRNTFYVPYGIDLEKFSYRPVERKDNRIFKVLFLGRLTLQKGIDVLIQAIKIINEKVSSSRIHFYIAGSGPLLPIIEKLEMITNNVKYIGFVENGKKLQALEECHILVMPSFYESFGLVWLEAQACGLPVIASNIPPLNDLIDMKGGDLFEVGNPTALAQKIMKYYVLWRDHFDDFVKASLAARKNAEKYDIRKISYQLAKFFLTLRKGIS